MINKSNHHSSSANLTTTPSPSVNLTTTTMPSPCLTTMPYPISQPNNDALPIQSIYTQCPVFLFSQPPQVPIQSPPGTGGVGPVEGVRAVPFPVIYSNTSSHKACMPQYSRRAWKSRRLCVSSSQILPVHELQIRLPKLSCRETELYS